MYLMISRQPRKTDRSRSRRQRAKLKAKHRRRRNRKEGRTYGRRQRPAGRKRR